MIASQLFGMSCPKSYEARRGKFRRNFVFRSQKGVGKIISPTIVFQFGQFESDGPLIHLDGGQNKYCPCCDAVSVAVYSDIRLTDGLHWSTRCRSSMASVSPPRSTSVWRRHHSPSATCPRVKVWHNEDVERQSTETA